MDTLHWIYWFYVKGSNFLGYTDLFSSNEYQKNNKISLKYFQ